MFVLVVGAGSHTQHKHPHHLFFPTLSLSTNPSRHHHFRPQHRRTATPTTKPPPPINSSSHPLLDLLSHAPKYPLYHHVKSQKSSPSSIVLKLILVLEIKGETSFNSYFDKKNMTKGHVFNIFVWVYG